MTEAVILHASGVSIPELRIRFGRTDHHLRNLMNTDQAASIIKKIQAESLKNVHSTASQKISLIKEKALDSMLDLMSNEDLKTASPFAFWDASRKTLDTVSKMDTPAPVERPSIQQNIQQNFIAASPELLNRLRSAPSMTQLEVPTNVEYLGSPPTGSTAQGVLGSGHRGTSGEGKNGLTLLGGRDSAASGGERAGDKNQRSAFSTSVLMDEASRKESEQTDSVAAFSSEDDILHSNG